MYYNFMKEAGCPLSIFLGDGGRHIKMFDGRNHGVCVDLMSRFLPIILMLYIIYENTW